MSKDCPATGGYCRDQQACYAAGKCAVSGGLTGAMPDRTKYLHDRIAERDHHGGWDCCVNLSEVSCERDGLLFALEAMGMEP